MDWIMGFFFAPTIKWAKDSIAIVRFPKKFANVREIVIEKLKMPVWPRLPSNFPFLTWFSEISAKNTSIKKKKWGGRLQNLGSFFDFKFQRMVLICMFLIKWRTVSVSMNENYCPGVFWPEEHDGNHGFPQKPPNLAILDPQNRVWPTPEKSSFFACTMLKTCI